MLFAFRHKNFIQCEIIILYFMMMKKVCRGNLKTDWKKKLNFSLISSLFVTNLSPMMKMKFFSMIVWSLWEKIFIVKRYDDDRDDDDRDRSLLAIQTQTLFFCCLKIKIKIVQNVPIDCYQSDTIGFLSMVFKWREVRVENVRVENNELSWELWIVRDLGSFH